MALKLKPTNTGRHDDDYLACYNDGHDWVHKE
jgi:hypothetical protein